MIFLIVFSLIQLLTIHLKTKGPVSVSKPNTDLFDRSTERGDLYEIQPNSLYSSYMAARHNFSIYIHRDNTKQ